MQKTSKLASTCMFSPLGWHSVCELNQRNCMYFKCISNTVVSSLLPGVKEPHFMCEVAEALEEFGGSESIECCQEIVNMRGLSVVEQPLASTPSEWQIVAYHVVAERITTHCEAFKDPNSDMREKRKC